VNYFVFKEYFGSASRTEKNTKEKDLTTSMANFTIWMNCVASDECSEIIIVMDDANFTIWMNCVASVQKQ